MVAAVVRKFFAPASAKLNFPHSSSSSLHQFSTQQILFTNSHFSTHSSSKLNERSAGNRIPIVVLKATSKNDQNIVQADSEDGVSLGTMKLPANIDIPRFESLLFQWANSLCQGSNLPLAYPLKVDKITGGARLAFITINNDGETEVYVYIDCLVTPSTDGSGPVFQAIRNGGAKDQTPPGEPRIMRSLLEALKKCVEIARV
ncbi:hypothetical protein C5167_044935 [Papaver somniferum]|uniref:DUF7148 domain-containing protein n=1 Tax=Papaver somniferum TaxID=3469 RepID=A0A4Y7LBU8_PAPSO|nr:uncharacterized protein LOC113321234 [Papaver somniferum]RZC82152.1 hypothetical protein C5167_044935 [Papaver somniferum]